MDFPKEFFTPQSMLTLAGATAITIAVANGIQYVLNRNPRWLALALAIAICIVGSIKSGQGKDWTDYLVAVFNGFLVFATARGGTFTLAQGAPANMQSLNVKSAGPARRRTFLTPW